MHGWPREHWSTLLDLPCNPGTLLPYLVEEVATLYPDATVTFRTLFLDCENEAQAIDNLSEPARSRLQKEIKDLPTNGDSWVDSRMIPAPMPLWPHKTAEAQTETIGM